MQNICLLSIFAAIFYLKSAGASEMENGVMILTENNFDLELAKNEFLLVEFNTPQCYHCKQLTPQYEGAAQELSQSDPLVVLAKVNTTEQKALSQRFGIRFGSQGFPILLFFRNGEKFDYTGGREKDAFVNWVQKMSGPPSKLITSCDALKEKIDNPKNKFSIAYFGPEDNSLFTEAHIPYAKTEDKIIFLHADLACQNKFGLSGDAKIVFFRYFEQQAHPYSGAPDKDSLNSFVKPLMVATMFRFTTSEIEFIFANRLNTAILFRDESDLDAPFMRTYKDAAFVHKGKMGKILFCHSGITHGIEQKIAKFMGITQDQLPVLTILTPGDMKKFQHPGKFSELTVDSIGTYIQDVFDGNVKPIFKSEAPVDSTGNAVSVIVGETFEEIAKDATKDVFVMFYAPWSGDSKQLAPIWEELGEFYKDNTNIVIAKFDGTVNDAEGVVIRGYPTLIFYSKDNKAGLHYSGEKELPNIKEWLAVNSPVLKETSGDGHLQEL